MILGTGVIYFLSRQISRPIQDVANAAVQVREGNYDIHFKEEEEIKEEEIYELIESFKEMTNRLKVMEKLQAELLAGVTHDLKTPVTSISGLIQAVKDDVVKGEQSKEFLDISLKETQRLQGMIEDLLNYNAISAGAFKIRVQKRISIYSSRKSLIAGR
ncbi:HAMP domain-containing protein [[Brevibacterium] frigoritolerans]|uniref:histidine kinase n=1 Tax=Peribacillus frigoritolerans TaxID=450367 RepID=A0A941FMT6_9BACI|nr:HAMP domain-containing protein [Peribacillus frigoritolerans]